MKIAQIAPIIERVPPKTYGGSERVVYELTEELVRRGHEVTLFASGDSITSAKLVSAYPVALREAKFEEIYAANHISTLNVGMAYQRYRDFDIIHDHNWTLSLPAANISPTPVVLTHHGPFLENVSKLFSELRRPYVIAISAAQARMAPPDANMLGVVHNGLTMEHYPFSKDHDGYLLWVGRMDPEKTPHRAITVAKRVGLPLILAGKAEMNIYGEYFRKYIEPELENSRGEVVWIGEVNETERNLLMSRAAAMLHPISWPEPFGLTMIEAMACGAPVIATNLGSVPEIVLHGKTGFVANSDDEMVEAVRNISSIDREACRIHALSSFNAVRMADGYETAYRRVLLRERTEHLLPRSEVHVMRELKRKGSILTDKEWREELT